MTTTLGARRLPLAARPIAGESLRSLLEETARRHEVPVLDVLRAAGVQVARASGAALHRLDNRVADSEGDGLCVALALDRDTLNGLTLHGGAGSVVAGWRQGLVRHLGWGVGGTGRHCPRCLAENGGRWLLAWLTPWTIVCVRHQVVLENACQACGEPPRSDGYANYWTPHGGRCTAKAPGSTSTGRHARSCNADLTDVEALQAPTTSYALLGQTYVDQVLADEPGGPAAQDRLKDLHFAARRLHRHYEPGDQPLTGLDVQAMDLWAQYRDGLRRALGGRAFWADTDTAIYRASFATCTGLAAQALGGTREDRMAVLTPLMAREPLGGLHLPYDYGDQRHEVKQRRLPYYWMARRVGRHLYDVAREVTALVVVPCRDVGGDARLA